MSYRNRKLSLVGASVFAVLAAAQSGAQEAQLEEIVVTARQRAERIEDVPVTITAFTQTEIKNAGIERPQDFIALTAGVSQVQTAEAGDLQVNIRGINTARDAETNFALVIDGVLQTNPNALNQELSGVSQIEILKGPQGALYGRNALAGAMIISTRKPGDSVEFDIGLGGAEYGSFKGNFYLGGPVGDTARGSISGYTRTTDGQWKNLDLVCDDCVDFFEESGFQARLLFPLAGGDVDVKAKYSTINAGAINFNASIALADVAPFVGPAFYADPNAHTFRYINNIAPKNEQENINFSVKGEWQTSLGTFSSYLAHNDQTNYFLTDGTSGAFLLYSLDATCRRTNDAKLTTPGYIAPFFAIPSNIWLTPAGNNGAGFLPPYGPTSCDGYQYQQRDQQDTSLELRLTSAGDQSPRWVAGVYAAAIERRVVVSQGSDLGRGVTAQPFVPTSGLNPTDLLYDDDFSSTVMAAFGQVAYDVTDNLELALALRYDVEDREVDNNVPRCSSATAASGPCRAQTVGFSFFSNPYINPAYTANPAFAASGIPSRSKEFSQLQPKLSANWKASEDFAVYASYGYGFRSGGFNSSGSAATIASAYGRAGGTTLCLGADFAPPTCGPNATLNITDVNDLYRKEVSKAAEVGFKSFFADRTISLNFAAFQTKVEDMQFFNFFAGPFGLLRVVTNIDEVSIKGYELDARWNVNENVSLFAGYAVTDGEIDKYTGRPYTKGGEVPYAPEYTGNAGIDIKFPVTTNWTVNARIDGSFVGETWFHPVQKQRLPNLFTYFGFGQGEFSKMSRDPYHSINARLGITNGTFSLTAWGRNVTDEEYLQEIIPAPEFGGSFIHDSAGKSYGLDFTYSFR
jgi:iron complex outermembrane receptor protein